MNFIKFAEKLGIDREASIKVYRLFNGGYFETLYYSKPPLLYKLREWPKKYLSKKIVYITTPQLSRAFETLLWVDTISLYGMSSKFTNSPLRYEILEKSIEIAYDRIKEYSTLNNIDTYPMYSNLDFFKTDFSEFIYDLYNKRLEEMKIDDLYIINDLAYDSKLMEEIKLKYPWAKNIGRDNAIRAFQLSDKVNEFLEYISPYIYYLASSKSLYFDNILISNNIIDTIKIIEKEGSMTIKEKEIKNEFQKKTHEIYQMIISNLNYF